MKKLTLSVMFGISKRNKFVSGVKFCFEIYIANLGKLVLKLQISVTNTNYTNIPEICIVRILLLPLVIVLFSII